MLPRYLVDLLRKGGIYFPLRDRWHDYLRRRNDRREARSWATAKYPDPPPAGVKHRKLLHFAHCSGIRELVETGTFNGDTVFALRKHFRAIHSIELSHELHLRTKARLEHLQNATFHFGNSACILPHVLLTLSGPTLFWLDGHYCAGPSAKGETDTPIAEELEVILSRTPGRDIILIDDARLFTGENDYPSLDWVRQYVKQKRPESLVEIESDIICIHPV